VSGSEEKGKLRRKGSLGERAPLREEEIEALEFIRSKRKTPNYSNLGQSRVDKYCTMYRL
jgi:hypothetical protein